MELGMGNVETRSEFVQGGGIVVDSLGKGFVSLAAFYTKEWMADLDLSRYIKLKLNCNTG